MAPPLAVSPLCHSGSRTMRWSKGPSMQRPQRSWTTQSSEGRRATQRLRRGLGKRNEPSRRHTVKHSSWGLRPREHLARSVEKLTRVKVLVLFGSTVSFSRIIFVVEPATHRVNIAARPRMHLSPRARAKPTVASRSPSTILRHRPPVNRF